jgi:transposase-like protein
MEERLPETLVEAIRYYSDPVICRNLVAGLRWPDGVTCPRCGCDRVTFMETVQRWNCRGCRKQFSVKVGTIFEDSPIELGLWFAGFWLIANAKNGISSCEVGRALGITQKSAWFLLHRIRLVMKTGTLDKQEGTFEVDETFVGGLEKNKHAHKKRNAGRGGVGKTIVLGILKRGNGTKDENGKRRRAEERIYSQVQATVIRNTGNIALQSEIAARVQPGSEVFTDAHRGYRGLEDNYVHAFVDHAVKYAEGRVTTNGIENFWSLLDRIVHGTYIKPEPQHLERYVDEQAFRFNHRGGTDLTRFLQALKQVSGKRLTYDELTTGHLQFIVRK